MAVPAQAQGLWGETSVGMSPEEVLNVTRNARRVKDGGTIGSGAKELLRVDDFEVVDKLFNVSFYFNAHKLEQVTLSLKDRRPFSSTVQTFNRLADVLRTKYGEEFSSKNSNDPVAKAVSISWISDRTEISLFAIAIGDMPAILTLTYSIGISKEADKL